jgi:microcystin-dependent protein
MSVLSPVAKMQFTDITGEPLVGGLLYTYEAGTTTPLATYTDNSGASLNSNPVVLNARGEANIWLGANTYKFKLTDSNNTEIWTVDNISPPTTALSPVLSGNVVINSNSSGSPLTITQTGTGPLLAINKNTTSHLYIASNGLVGFGTTAPQRKVDINDGALMLSSSGTQNVELTHFSDQTYLYLFRDQTFRLIINNIGLFTIDSAGVYSLNPVYVPATPTLATQAASKSYVDSTAANTTPPGVIAPYAGTSAPTGWLACQGQVVSQTTYASLYAAISTTWNTGGEGAGNFRLPDLRGMFVRGTGTNATGSSSGAVGPSVGAYATDTYLNHSHTATQAAHDHSYTTPGSNQSYNNGSGGNITTTFNGGGATTGTAQPAITVDTSTTGGTETKPKNYGVLYIIKT